MKAALLGLTHPHSGVLLTTLENLPWITAVNLWDSDPAVLARPPFPPSAKVSTAPPDLDALLAQPDLRFALVCVPTNQAASLAHRVIAARKHLVAEKPVGLTSDEIRGVQAQQRRPELSPVCFTRGACTPARSPPANSSERARSVRCSASRPAS